MTSRQPSESALPSGYRFVRELGRPGSRERVIQAELSGRAVVLRIAPSAPASESLAELAVLASVEHPGLARLVGHGVLPNGAGTWIAREWIEGVDLASWAQERDARDIGRMLARSCPALDALHARGFVHGDLKPGNLIVADDDRPVITDFGLARRTSASSSEVSGTFFGLGPELLLGGNVDARADLFALGVMLHELLVRRRPSAREFYGRFPAFDFFTATDTAPDDLPDWARDVVVALLERDPSRRPASASAVGRTLAGRLGLGGLFREPRVELRFPVATGREAWIEGWLAGAVSRSLDWIVVDPAQDVGPLCGELALQAALRGHRVQRVDWNAALRDVRDAAALDAWAVRTCAELGGAWLVVEEGGKCATFSPVERFREGGRGVGGPASSPPAAGDLWALRAIDSLARALRQTPADQRGALVVVAANPAPTPLDWRVLAPPPIGRDTVLDFVRQHVHGDAASLERLTDSLHATARGSAIALDAALQRCARDGWLLAGDDKPRLRPGTLPADLFASSVDADLELSPPSAHFLAALHVCGGEATLDQVAELAPLDERMLNEALSATLASGYVALEHRSGVARVRLDAAARSSLSGALDEQAWRSLHEARARQLERTGAPLAARLHHEFRAGLADAAQVAAECERLREQGCAELALSLCDALETHAGELPNELAGERGLAWVALGQPDRALEALANTPRDSALAERVRGQVASFAHDFNAALAHFERARELDPDDGGLTALAKARVLYELQRDREVLELVDALRREPGRVQRRIWANLLGYEALCLFRRGEVDRALELLTSYVDDARSTGDTSREAALAISLATVERRAGNLERAAGHLEHAIELHDRSGVIAGVAQARAMLGGVLRDQGELKRAQPLLLSALAIRERLGDEVGATAVRGMLGLTLAERGHARPAIEELERSAALLRASGRNRDALLLEARALEMRARTGQRATPNPRAQSESDRLGEGDPRVLASRARTARLNGEEQAAADYLRRADELARGLGLSALLAETSFLARQIEGAAAEAPANDTSSLTEQDERVFALLSHAPFDFERARELADELERRGRDDRAARVWLAVAARAAAGVNVDADWVRAYDALALCVVGCSATEIEALRRTLLGVPDPWPEDFVAHDRLRTNHEEDEMEVVRLLEINHRLVAQEDLRTLLGTIVEQALAISGAQRGFLILEENGELEVDTAMDSRRGGIDTPDVEVSGSVLRDALARMRPLRVSNALEDPRLGAAPSVINLDLRSILCVPFDVQKGLRGVIYVDHRLREGAFDARAERMLTLLADQASLAIGQVRRLEEIRRLNRELGKRMARTESDLRTATETLRKASLPKPAAGLVGNSAPMQRVRALIERAAQTKLSVLVTGPSGSGKELAARALHELGNRSEGPFVAENCAALPGSLIEAELFGARRGAFTGAERDREGLFEQAHGGTLFLDEIGELPLDLQAKLLRVLETSQVRRLGDDQLRTVDFRLVTATNRDLAREVREGRFRADLFYRLDGLRIEMPSLAVRPDDIPALVDHCLRLQSTPGGPTRTISAAVMAKLCRREWPGNVRELFNEVARLLVLSEGDVDDLSLVRDIEREPLSVAGASGEVLQLEELERRAILRAIEVAGGDKRKAAELLGISRAKVYQRLKDWNEAAGASSESAV